MKKLAVIVFLISAFGFQSCAVRVVERSQPNVVVVKKAPRNHRVVVIKKKRYYTWGGKYYRKTRRGYVRVRV
ncbi:DUF6515 family protein [Flavobacteriaceae bacterium S356]|uniref:DUF6515 family protein n=1 Tax=Asprobacillus argus TaxID=3076534 RepID=A0ABU3LG52_9FLAO|nr:DUF6515 family protein [Flavobacteriaceae bacterium S356]